MKALKLEVFRSYAIYEIGDCTNGGISSRFNEVFLICDAGNRELDEENPPENTVKLVQRLIDGRVVNHLEPINRPTGAGWMFGGNFAYTSDSRLMEMVGGMYGAIAIHDRQEWQNDYLWFD